MIYHKSSSVYLQQALLALYNRTEIRLLCQRDFNLEQDMQAKQHGR